MAKCEEKSRYLNRDSATQSAKQLNANGATGLLPYRCRTCEWWHIGHDSPTAFKRHGMEEQARIEQAEIMASFKPEPLKNNVMADQLRRVYGLALKVW